MKYRIASCTLLEALVFARDRCGVSVPSPPLAWFSVIEREDQLVAVCFLQRKSAWVCRVVPAFNRVKNSIFSAVLMSRAWIVGSGLGYVASYCKSDLLNVESVIHAGWIFDDSWSVFLRHDDTWARSDRDRRPEFDRGWPWSFLWSSFSPRKRSFSAPAMVDLPLRIDRAEVSRVIQKKMVFFDLRLNGLEDRLQVLDEDLHIEPFSEVVHDGKAVC